MPHLTNAGTWNEVIVYKMWSRVNAIRLQRLEVFRIVVRTFRSAHNKISYITEQSGQQSRTYSMASHYPQNQATQVLGTPF